MAGTGAHLVLPGTPKVLANGSSHKRADDIKEIRTIAAANSLASRR